MEANPDPSVMMTVLRVMMAPKVMMRVLTRRQRRRTTMTAPIVMMTVLRVDLRVKMRYDQNFQAVSVIYVFHPCL